VAGCEGSAYQGAQLFQLAAGALHGAPKLRVGAQGVGGGARHLRKRSPPPVGPAAAAVRHENRRPSPGPQPGSHPPRPSLQNRPAAKGASRGSQNAGRHHSAAMLEPTTLTPGRALLTSRSSPCRSSAPSSVLAVHAVRSALLAVRAGSRPSHCRRTRCGPVLMQSGNARGSPGRHADTGLPAASQHSARGIAAGERRLSAKTRLTGALVSRLPVLFWSSALQGARVVCSYIDQGVRW